MTATQGLDPLFNPVDGTDAPNLDVSTFSARQIASKLLLQKGVFRISIPMPDTTTRDFDLTAINDPYNYASDSGLSLFRRPLASTNLQYQTTLMWDGRESANNPILVSNTLEQNQAALNADLAHQSIDATTGHAQASVTPTTAQQQDIVTFEMGLTTAQSSDNLAGSLSDLGATGGSVPLYNTPFTVGENQFGSQNFNQNVFTLYSSWSSLTGTDSVSLARESIARGETIFNTRQFTISGVNGLNDVPGGQTTITNGTCSVCHSALNIGSNASDIQMNTGISLETFTSGVNPNFPEYTFTNRGTGEVITLEDPGLGLITGKWADIGKFKIPTLRGLASRGPYMHNGTATSLRDLVHSYDLRFTIGFSEREKDDLINFLNAL
jgi:hypothetical protein